MEQKNKNMLIGGLLAIVLVMAVGYAAFATQLTINGTANITSNWDVHIQSIAMSAHEGTGADSVDGETKVDPDNPLAATFKATLISPGDSVTYDVTVVNAGTLPAKVSSITVTQANTGVVEVEPSNNPVTVTPDVEGGTYKTADDPSNPIVYTVSGIKEGDVIEKAEGDAGTTKVFQVKVEYNSAVQTQPTKDQLESTLKVELNFVQHTDSP